jgi:hypothetical protein
MRRIPVAEDIEPQELAEIVTEGDFSPVAKRLGVSVEHLQKLFLHDELMHDLIQAGLAEVEAMARIRMALLLPKALDTLEKIMDSYSDPKLAMPRVKAATEIFDRFFSKAGRNQPIPVTQDRTSLPDLGTLLANAADPEAALAMAEKHRNLMGEIDELREQAREKKVEVINVTPEVIQQ